ncbi:filamentous hemagglutinin N-terminal domain-containing protein [Sphingomonas jatrophae]|uniref:Filamentous hemagglutinin family N-terminal domain-containing protein n=1 Tax=Sphingomonas jatrophae TaxID=1166337 RepID=A0A1I6LKE0_9SPHN|nr:filamentous hemagglutinin N-terminal domain-containing protein [Sphingomonas jatrophae]SFS03944.1 filamentous hemagglutinin family N-terminal domain-containing protein [Sphingomonas jatrophae]
MSNTRTSLRAKLSLTTALVGGVIGITTPARVAAQPALPSGASVGAGTVGFRVDGAATAPGDVTGAGTRLDVDLGSSRSIINWNTFNVGRVDAATPNVVQFNNGSGGDAAVLNRVIGAGGASGISGTIQSDPNVSVYLINPQGITFGSGANVNVGAMIASTLGITDADFNNDTPFGNFSTQFTGTGGAINISGGTISTRGDLVFIGAQVTATGGTQSAGGDTGFIVGQDVTVARTTGSPLAFTIAAGSTVDADMTVNSTVNGQTVTLGFARAAGGGIARSLLVGGRIEATSAVATDRGIVLAAGSVFSPSVSMPSNLQDSGIVQSAGAAPAGLVSGGRINVQGAGAVSLAGNMTAGGQLTVGGTSVSVTGTVSAGGNYNVGSGSSITLGGTQSANGAVSVRASSSITGNAGLVLTANAAGASATAADNGLTLRTTDANGSINFATATPGTTTTSLVAGTAASRTDLTIVQLGDGSPLALGNVTANSLLSTTLGTPPTATPGVSRLSGNLRFNNLDLNQSFSASTLNGSIAVGAVTIRGDGQTLTLDARGGPPAGLVTATGNLAADGAITVTGQGAVNLAGLSTRDGDATITSTGSNVFVTGGVAGTSPVTGDVSIEGGSVTLGDAGGAARVLAATGGVTLTARGAGTITGRSGLTLTGNSGGAGSEAITFVPGAGGIAFAGTTIIGGTAADGTPNRSSDVFVGAGDTPLTLGNVTARTLAPSGSVGGIVRSTAFTAGTLDVANTLDVRALSISTQAVTVRNSGALLRFTSDGGTIGTGALTNSGGNVTLNAIGGGTINVGNIVSAGATTATGSNLVTTGTINAGDDVTVRGSTVTVGAITASPAGADVILEALGDNLIAPTIIAGGNVSLTASLDVTVPGAISADGTYDVTGNAVGLGVDADAETQRAGGAVTITARTGGITGGENLTLQSGSGAGANLTLRTNAAGQAINFAANSQLNGGSETTRTAVILATADQAGATTLGNVRAAALRSSVGAGGILDGVTRTGNLTVGAVDLTGATLALTSTGGNVSVGAINVTGANNGVSLTAANGALTNSTGAAALAAMSASGGIILTARDGFSTGQLTSTGADGSTAPDITATSTAGTLTAAGASAVLGNVRLSGATGLTVTAAEGVDIALTTDTGTITASTLTARDDIAVRGPSLQGGTWRSGATVGGLAATDAAGVADTLAGGTLVGADIDATGGRLLLTTAQAGLNSVSSNDDLRLTATDTLLQLGGGSVAGNATLTKTGATDLLSVTGTLNIGTANGNAATLGSAVIRSQTAAQLNTVIASGDLDVQSTGVGLVNAITLTNGGGRDVVLRAAGTIVATTLSARDDIVIRAGAAAFATGTSWTSGTGVAGLGAADVTGAADAVLGAGALAGNDIDVAANAITIQRIDARGTGSDIRLDGAIVQPLAEADFYATAGGNVTLNSAVQARDIAISAGERVSVLALTARDDVAIRGGAGGISTGTITSGATANGAGPTDAAGAADALLPAVNFTGQDVDLASSGPITFAAIQSADDVRINGGGTIGDAAADLVITATGAIALGNTAIGRDIALNGASVSTAALNARDDIAIRADTATGTISTGAMQSGVEVGGLAPVETGAAGAADLLAGGLLAGADIDARGATVLATTATANGAQGDLRLTATARRLELGTGTAGADVLLTKQGADTNDLIVTGTVTAGTAAGAPASVTIVSATNVRLNNAVALADPLSATQARDVNVTATGAVRAGTLTAARDVRVTAGADAEIAGTVQAGRDYLVQGGRVLLGETNVAVRQQANGRVRIVSTAGGIDGRAGLTLVANQDDMAAGAESLVLDATGGNIAFVEGTTLLGGATNRASNIGVRLATPGSSLTLGTVAARSLRGTDATGTTFGALALDAGNVAFVGDVSVRAGLQVTTSGDIATRKVTVTGFDGARQSLVLSGRSLTATDTLAAEGDVSLSTGLGLLSLNASGGALGAQARGGNLTIVAGGDATGTGIAAAGSVTSTVAGNDSIAVVRAGLIVPLIGETDPNPDGVTVPPASAGLNPADATLTAGSMTKTLVSAGRDVAIRTTTGDATVQDVSAGDDIAIRAAGAIVGTGWVSGVAPSLDAAGAADTLVGAVDLTGNDIDVAGSSVRIGAATANGFLSDIRIAGPVSGGDPAGDLSLTAGGNISLTNDAVARDVALGAGGFISTAGITAQDDIALRAGGGIGVGALQSGVGAIDATGVADTLVGATLDGNDIDIAGASFGGTTITTGNAGGDLAVLARSDALVFTTGDIAGAARIEKQGGVDELQVTTLTTGGATPAAPTTILSSTSIRLGTVTSQSGTLTVTAANEATGIGAGGRATLTTLDAASDVLVTAGTLARLATVTAARDFAGTTNGAGAPTIDVTAASAGRDIALSTGTLVATTLAAGDDIAIRTTGTATGLSWTSGATIGGTTRGDAPGAADTLLTGVDLTGRDTDVAATAITIGTVRAVGADADIRLSSASVTGGTVDGDLDLGAGRDIVLTGNAAGRDVALGAARDITVARIDARDDIAIRATGAVVTGDLASGVTVGGLGPVDAAGVADALLGGGTALAGNDIQVDGGTVRISNAAASGVDGDLRVTAGSGRLEVTGTGSAGRNVSLTKLGTTDTLVAGTLIAGRDVTGNSATSATIGTAEAGRDVAIGTAIDLTLGTGTGRDIALNAGGNVIATTLAARDDIAIRAGGTVTGDSWTSGAAADEPGSADALLTGIDMTGNDIDVAGTAIAINRASANGAGSDVRLRGPVTSGSGGANDLAITTGGDITLIDAAQGRDVALSAGGAVTAVAIIARDDVAIRAGGAIRTAAIVSGGSIGGLGPVDVAGAADALTGTALAGNDIDAAGASFFAPSATANGTGGDLRLTATTGRLELTSGSVGGRTTLTKLGGDDLLLVNGLTGGIASADADVTLTSDTAIQFGVVAAATGNVTLTAKTDIGPISGALFNSLVAIGETKDIRVVAGRNVTLGNVSSGRDLAVVAGTAGGSAGTIDLTNAGARDIALTARGGDILTGNLSARDDIAVRADGNISGSTWSSGTLAGADSDASGVADVLVTGDAAAGSRWARTSLTGAADIVASAGGAITITSLTATGGNLGVDAASITVTGTTVDRDAALTARTGSIQLDTLASGGAAALTAADAITANRLETGPLTATAGGAIRVVSLTSGPATIDGGSVTIDQLRSGDLSVRARTGDLTLASATADRADVTGAATLTTDAGDIIVGQLGVTGPASFTSASDVRLRTVSSGGAMTIVAGAGEVTGIDGGRADLTAGGALTITGGTLVRLGSASAGSDLAVTADTIDVTNATATAGALSLVADVGSIALGTGAAGTSATIDAGTTAAIGTLSAGDAASVRSRGATTIGTIRTTRGPITLDGAALTVGTAAAGGALAATARSGDLTLTSGRAGGTATLTSGGSGDIVVTTLTSGGATTITSASDARLGDIVATGGALQVTAAAGEVTGIGAGAANLRSGNGAVTVTGGTLARLGTVDAGTLIDVSTDRIATTRATARGGLLRLVADVGDLTLGDGSATTSATLTATGAVTVTGGVAAAGGDTTIRGASATIGTASASQALTLTTTGAATLANGTAGGNATLAIGGPLSVTSAITAGGALSINAASATIENATGGTNATLAIAGNLRVRGKLEATRGNLAVTAASADAAGLGIGTAVSGQAMTLTATAGNLQLTSATAGTTFELNAANEAVIGLASAEGTGGVTVGGSGRTAANSAVIRANELDLYGPLTAGAVQLVNRSPVGATTATMVLGDFTAGTSGASGTTIAAPTGGFDLTAAQFNRITSPTITLVQTFGDAARNVVIGNVTLAAGTGSSRIDVLTTGRIDLYGTVTDAGAISAGRTLQLGGTRSAIVATGGSAGTPEDVGRASLIVATATPQGGGRILLGGVTQGTPGPTLSGDATVDLRANRIAFGLRSDFLGQPDATDATSLNLSGNGTGIDFSRVAREFISNSTSTLYNSAARNPANTYADGANLLTATTLRVTYGDYALFQNTGQPNRANPNTGVVAGNLVSLTSQGPSSGPAGPNGLALFGVINQLQGSSAALQGGSVIVLNTLNPANSRINGCLVGSGGGGCLINAVATPLLNIFDEARANIFRTADDLAVQFDPVVGTNNESLFSDLGTIDFQFDDQKCDPATDSTCPAETPTDQ